jgi:hypothetical protein
MVCEEKLASSILQESREVVAKSTMPATDGVSED